MSDSRKPTHVLVMTPRDRSRPGTRVGAGWWNEERGMLTFQLNPGTVLSHRDCEDYMLGFFEDKPKAPSVADYQRRQRSSPDGTMRHEGGEPPDGEDDPLYPL